MEELFASFDTTTEIYSNWIVRFFIFSTNYFRKSVFIILGVFGLQNKLKKGTVIEELHFL